MSAAVAEGLLARETRAREGLPERALDWTERDVAAWADGVLGAVQSTPPGSDVGVDTAGSKLLVHAVNGECLLEVPTVFAEVGINKIGHLYSLKKARERLIAEERTALGLARAPSAPQLLPPIVSPAAKPAPPQPSPRTLRSSSATRLWHEAARHAETEDEPDSVFANVIRRMSVGIVKKSIQPKPAKKAYKRELPATRRDGNLDGDLGASGDEAGLPIVSSGSKPSSRAASSKGARRIHPFDGIEEGPSSEHAKTGEAADEDLESFLFQGNLSEDAARGRLRQAQSAGVLVIAVELVCSLSGTTSMWPHLAACIPCMFVIQQTITGVYATCFIAAIAGVAMEMSANDCEDGEGRGRGGATQYRGG